MLGDMEGVGSHSEALEGGAAFGALQGLMQTWLHAAVMDQNWCASGSAISNRAATLNHACRILQHRCAPARNAYHHMRTNEDLPEWRCEPGRLGSGKP